LNPPKKNSFGEAFDLRQEADYDVQTTVDEDEAYHVVSTAKEFVEQAHRILAEEGVV